MKIAAFKRLEKGNAATLATARPDYTCGHATPDGRAYVPAGTRGTVSLVNVPSVTGNRVFACLDFPAGTPLEDCDGRPVKHWDPRNGYRVAVYADELE